MCGIFCSLHKQNARPDDAFFSSSTTLNARGPDYQNSKAANLSNGWQIWMYSTVLHMRGKLCTQPLHDKHVGSYLLWNGEIFGGVDVDEDENDGEILYALLNQTTSDNNLLHVFRRLQGPYAFVYYQASTNSIWFGRDVFGRRSLTFCMDTTSGSLYLSSVAVECDNPKLSLLDWKEMPAAGIYKLSFTEGCCSDRAYDIKCHPWSHSDIQPDTTLCPNHSSELQPSLQLVGFRALNTEPPDGGAELDDAIPKNLLDPGLNPLEVASHWLDSECSQLLDVLKLAVRCRVSSSSFYCDTCVPSAGALCDKRSHISIMFSGGIDSMMLAYLADLCVPAGQSIDLLNVAFECGSDSKSGNVDYNVPDRVTGLSALAELNPHRQWNFVQINVTKTELQVMRSVTAVPCSVLVSVADCRSIELFVYREERVARLIVPLHSVLDDSIGCAMWFASRGRGVIVDPCTGQPSEYTSQARVVLSGLGADEQLGGYSRHRSSYQSRGWDGLVEEVAMDIRRISARNLGRDDRVISDHGKESRFPFLDERVVSFLNSLPVHKKMNMELERGVGEKLLLRACAYRCKLYKSAAFAKRAIQFGSRIAKAENRKEKGSDSCNRLRAATSGSDTRPQLSVATASTCS